MKSNQSIMKRQLNLQKIEPNMLEKPIQQVYEEINKKCNDFLKTQQGLQYLLLKYPKLSFNQAILEYYYSAMIADNYDPTCQTEL